MIYGDKEFGKFRFLFPTPTDIPEEVACRTFRIPADAAWLGLFMGAVSLLTDEANYQQFEGGISPAAAAETALEIINFVYEHAEDGCTVCLLPTGEPIVRIAPGGAVQQLTSEGWQTPTGDMTPPDIPPRSGGTPQDQMCLAAANAMNVLKDLYEVLSDSYNGGLTNAETLSEFLLAIALFLAAAVALWVAALIALIIIVWDILYDTLEFVGADLWDSSVDEAIQCILYNCASNDAGVVTFDYDCVINELAAGTDVTSSLTFDQLRLFGQMVYILSFIGGDGLNVAGTTTAITSADCSECAVWCYEVTDFDGEDICTLVASNTGCTASFSGGGVAACNGSANSKYIVADFHLPASANVKKVTLTWGATKTRSGTIWDELYLMTYGTDTILQTINTQLATGTLAGQETVITMDITGINVFRLYQYTRQTGTSGALGWGAIKFEGEGDNPFGEDNCTPS